MLCGNIEGDEMEDEIKDLKAQIKRWEDKEVDRAMHCCGLEEKLEKANQEIGRLKERLESGETDWVTRT